MTLDGVNLLQLFGLFMLFVLGLAAITRSRHAIVQLVGLVMAALVAASVAGYLALVSGVFDKLLWYSVLMVLLIIVAFFFLISLGIGLVRAAIRR
jgi:predicted histidine transporter YuiF (NhaC family)